MNGNDEIPVVLISEIRRLANDPAAAAAVRRSLFAILSPNGDFRSGLLQFASELERLYIKNDGETETIDEQRTTGAAGQTAGDIGRA